MRAPRRCAFSRTTWFAHESDALAGTDAAAFRYCKDCTIWVMDDYPCSANCVLAAARELDCGWQTPTGRTVRHAAPQVLGPGTEKFPNLRGRQPRRLNGFGACSLQCSTVRRAWTQGAKRPKVVLQDLKRSEIRITAVACDDRGGT